MALANYQTPPLQPDRLYHARDVASLLSVSVGTLYGWMKNDTFPKPRRIGPRAVRWTGRQIIDYVTEAQAAEGQTIQ